MVALPSTFSERFVAPSDDLIAGRLRLVSFTRSDAEALVRMGIVPEDASTELLNGWIVLKDRSALGQDPTMIGKDHTKCVEKLSDLRMRLNGPERHVESQQPLVCNDTHQPEPDFMVLRGTLDSYTDAPFATDAFCVVEVADSSYERDAGQKLIGYARAGVQQYIIINLRNHTAEVYSNPDVTAGTYGQPQIITAEGTLSLRVGAEQYFEVMLSSVLA